MKNLPLTLFSLLFFNSIYAQKSDLVYLNSTINQQFLTNTKTGFENVKNKHLNTGYLKSIDNSNASLIVENYENYIATYDLINTDIYDDSEKAKYQVEFKGKNVLIHSVYNNLGEIISTNEKYINIRIPYELTKILMINFPHWTMKSNSYLVFYDKIKGCQKIYIVKMKRKNQIDILKFNSNFEPI